jgi:hypothetical protein
MARFEFGDEQILAPASDRRATMQGMDDQIEETIDEPVFTRELIGALRRAETAEDYASHLSLSEVIEELELWLADERQWRRTRADGWHSLLDDAAQAIATCRTALDASTVDLTNLTESLGAARNAFPRKDTAPDDDLRRKLTRLTAKLRRAASDPEASVTALDGLVGALHTPAEAEASARVLLDLGRIRGRDPHSVATRIADLVHTALRRKFQILMPTGAIRMSDELPPAQRFAALIAEVNESAGSLAAWNDRVDWDHGTRQMADFYTPLSSQNRLYVEWVYSRLSSLLNAVMVAAIPVRRDTTQESAMEMLFGRTIADLQAIGFLINKGNYPQAHGAARMTYECCDLADLSGWTPRPARNGSARSRPTATSAGAASGSDFAPLALSCPTRTTFTACSVTDPIRAGPVLYTLIEPHKATTDPLSDVDASVFHWDAGY